MNASNRPLNLLLAILALCLVTWCVWLMLTPTSAPEWLPPAGLATADASAPQPATAADPGLDTFANTWQSPLFSPSRTPDEPPRVARASPDLVGVKLTGVIVGGGQRVALLKQADGRDVKLTQGASLPNGWTLKRVEPLAVYFEYDGNVRELLLPAPRAQSPAQSRTQSPPPALPREQIK